MSEQTRIATDPHRSVVVEACAGSGKTWMLVTRIFRLLLAGAAPDSILAITFTRKAADEMLERLDQLLEQCVLLPDAELAALLNERCCPSTPDEIQRTRAVALSVFRARRGVEINTFHGWFTSLCQLAPAGIGFSRQAEPSELDTYWLDQAWLGWMSALEQGSGDAVVRERFNDLVRQRGIWFVRSALLALVRQRAAWTLMRQGPDDDALQAQLRQQFQVDELKAQLAAFFSNATLLDCARLLVQRLGDDGARNSKLVAPFLQAFADRDLKAIGKVLRDSEGGRRAIALTKPARARLGAADLQALDDAVTTLQDAHEPLMHAQDDLAWYEASAAALALLPSFVAHYEDVKSSAGVIDFEDLEITAARIMADEDASAWVQMRLDRRTRHLLLDEFQDTNPLQWSILSRWLSSQPPDGGQTVFMVGDPKQSIYRFRRAEARLFAHAKEWLRQHFQAEVLTTDHSRRCARGVLDAVNAAFVGPQAARQGQTPVSPHHGFYDMPGSGLYVLDLVTPAQAPALAVRSDWLTSPRGGVDATDAQEGDSEADQIAATLLEWKRNGRIQRWNAVMVLVRRHADAQPLGSALQARAVPHTINDRGGRFATLLWSDSIALLRVLLSPLNEKSLLQLLRSPFFDIAPAQLQAWLEVMAMQPASDHLRARTSAHAISGPVADALQAIERWRQWAVEMPLHDVLERIFRETGIEAATLARVPEQERDLARSHWNWMLAWALDVGKGRMPHPLRALEEAARLTEHGRAASETDAGDDTVRIYTVHASKGLEADIVWLMGSNSAPTPETHNEVKTLLHWPIGDYVPLHLSLYQGSKDRGGLRSPWFAAEQQAVRDEADHILYVAMTRARHALYVSGTVGRKSDDVVEGGWYQRLSQLNEARRMDWDAVRQISAATGVAQGAVGPDVNTDVLTTAARPDANEPPVERVTWATLPDIAALEVPIGHISTASDTLATRRGEAWHACLEHIDSRFFDAFDHWWSDICQRPACADALMRVDDAVVLEVRQRLLALAGRLEVRPLLDPAAADASFNEFEWMDSRGGLHRADRIIRIGQDWRVLDYKWSWTEADLPDYQAQLRRYGQALRQTLAAGGSVTGCLLSSLGEQVTFNLGE